MEEKVDEIYAFVKNERIERVSTFMSRVSRLSNEKSEIVDNLL